jgi:osmotically inducible protein OsmC
MAAERRADVTWTGSLAGGEGVIEFFSGATGNLPVTWASRTDRSAGMTSPEELIAAAHASCFSMALSNTLSESGHEPERLHVIAKVTFDQEAGKIASSDLEVRGKVRGLDANGFADAAAVAKDGCPVSRALSGNVPITVKAVLE